jgi:hypothetical protein
MAAFNVRPARADVGMEETWGRLVRALGAIAAVTVMVLVPGLANASVLIYVTRSGVNVDVTATGSLDLTGATFNHQQPS